MCNCLYCYRPLLKGEKDIPTSVEAPPEFPTESPIDHVPF